MENRFRYKPLDEIIKNIKETSISKEDKEHLTLLTNAIKNRQYKVARDLYASKMKEGFFKSKYQNLLPDIEPHIRVVNEADKDARLLKLISAIHATSQTDNEFVEVKKALQTGSTIVLNETFYDNSIHKFQLQESAIIQALQGKNKGLINYLISQGATSENLSSLVILTEKGETALHIACELKLYDIIPNLLDETSINAKRSDGFTPLAIACMNDDFILIKLLVNKNADASTPINLNDGTVTRPFLMMLQKKQIALAELMMDKSNILKESETILHVACEYNIFVPELINAITINKKRADGMTPLLLACANNNTALAMQLLENGANPDDYIHKEEKIMTPISIALENNNIELAEVMVNSSSHQSQHEGDTLWHLASESNDSSLRKNILSGANPKTINQKRKDGLTPLMIACKNNDTEFALSLMGRGAKPNESTYLMAVQQNNQKLIEAMHNRGFKPITPTMAETTSSQSKPQLSQNLSDIIFNQYKCKSYNKGDTFLHIVCENKLHHLIPEVIKQEPDSLNMKRQDGMTPLLIACRNSDINSAIALIKHGADPNIPTNHDYLRPLYIACKNNNTELAKILLENKADPNLTSITATHQKVSPFMVALENKNIELAKLMLDKNYKVQFHDLRKAEAIDKDFFRILKDPIRARRKQIKTKGPIIFLDMLRDKNHSNILKSILSRSFIENPNLSSTLGKKLQLIYESKNQILKPLLDLVALATEGRHLENNPDAKRLKILMSNKENIYDISGHDIHTRGNYNLKNTIYIGGRDEEKALSVMLHELQHFAEKEIYGDLKTDMPYVNQEFENIKNKLKMRSDEFLKNISDKKDTLIKNTQNSSDEYIYSSIINSVFVDYDPSVHNLEILVRVPEILGYLGVNEGYLWLQKHEPELLNFYEKRFIPDCKVYLEQKAKVKAANDENFNENQTSIKKNI